jgi:hypothetical protein
VLSVNPLYLSDSVVPTRAYTLSDDITAMQILPLNDSGARLSPVSRLPRGARIQACGEGFDDRTLKVEYQGQYYFVFLDDLEPRKMTAATAV